MTSWPSSLITSHSFVRSFVRLFVHSFVRSFVRSLTDSDVLEKYLKHAGQEVPGLGLSGLRLLDINSFCVDAENTARVRPTEP